MTDIRKIYIPFSGFYNSIWDDEIDRTQECDVEYISEEYGISEGDAWELVSDTANYTEMHQEIAKAYCDDFSDATKHLLEIESLTIEYTELQSPKFYNYSTDSILGTINLDAVKAMLAMHNADEYVTLSGKIHERHSSCDGFYSYYSNNLDTWLAKPIEDWDENELETLLIASIEMESGTQIYDFERTICEDMPINEVICNCYDSDKYNARLSELMEAAQAKESK
jgi:hypothetical protein